MPIRFTALIWLTALLAVGCETLPANNPEPTPEPPTPEPTDSGPPPTPTLDAAPEPPDPFPGEGPWAVTFPSRDGITLNGTVYGKGSTALLLAPMVPGEQAGWSSFGAAAGEAGYRALTFDFRGYGGSQGERNLSLSPEDIAGGIAFLREIGAERVIVIGAGQGGAGAIRLAASGESFTGLAVLSSSFSRDGIEISEADLAALTLPSLWIASRQDMLQDVEALYDLAGSPVKSIWMYEALGVHGTYILETMDGADLTRRLLDFAAFVEGGS